MQKILIVYFLLLLSSCAILVDNELDVDNANSKVRDKYTLQ